MTLDEIYDEDYDRYCRSMKKKREEKEREEKELEYLQAIERSNYKVLKTLNSLPALSPIPSMESFDFIDDALHSCEQHLKEAFATRIKEASTVEQMREVFRDMLLAIKGITTSPETVKSLCELTSLLEKTEEHSTEEEF